MRCSRCLLSPALERWSAGGGLLVSGDLQLHELSDGAAAVIRRQFLESHAGVLLARAQRPGDERGLRLAARVAGLGDFVRTAQGSVQPYSTRGRRGTPAAGQPRGSDFWHQDNSYFAAPSRLTALYATDRLPEGEGDTLFINLVHAFETLDVELSQKAQTLQAWHCHAHNAGHPHPQYPDGPHLPAQLHPLVHKHPITGRLALFLSPCYLKALETTQHEQDHAKSILQKLMDHATQERFVFRHSWQPGDFLVWDNHVVMHKATTIDMSPELERIMFRMSFGD